MKKIISISTTVIIVVLLIFIFWLRGVNQNNNQQEQDGTSNWNTYQNNEYGFEFMYPDTRSIKDEKRYPEQRELVIDIYDPNVDTPHGAIRVTVLSNPNNFTLKEFYKYKSDTSEIPVPNYFESTIVENTTISGIESVQFQEIYTPPAPIVVVRTSILIDKKIIEIDLQKRTVEENGEIRYEKARQIYDLILESFKVED